MSVVDVIESWEDTTAEQSAGITADTGSAIRVFTVKFSGSDNPKVEPILALSASAGGISIPELWEPHPASETWYVVRKSVNREAPHYYRVSVYYEYVENPLEQEPEISFDFVSTQEQIDFYYDSNGNPQAITNSSGETFDPPVTRDFYDLLVRITRNQDAYSAILAAQYEGSINSDSLWGLPVGTVKCNVFRADLKRYSSTYYYTVNYEFQIRFDGWARRVLDQGFRTKTGTDENNKPTYEIMKDDDDKPLSQPVLLNGNGGKLNDGAPPVFLTFNIHRCLPFSVLQLPNL